MRTVTVSQGGARSVRISVPVLAHLPDLDTPPLATPGAAGPPAEPKEWDLGAEPRSQWRAWRMRSRIGKGATNAADRGARFKSRLLLSVIVGSFLLLGGALVFHRGPVAGPPPQSGTQGVASPPLRPGTAALAEPAAAARGPIAGVVAPPQRLPQLAPGSGLTPAGSRDQTVGTNPAIAVVAAEVAPAPSPVETHLGHGPDEPAAAVRQPATDPDEPMR